MLYGDESVAFVDERLVVAGADGVALRSVPVSHIAEVGEPELTPDVYIRLFTQEEIILPAASFKEADRIVAWARAAPRLQRRAQHQRRELRSTARLHLILGGLCCLLGFGITALSYQQTDPGGYYLVMFGPIIVGACDFLYGIGLYVTEP